MCYYRYMGRSAFQSKEEYNAYMREYRKRNLERIRAYKRWYNAEYRMLHGYPNEEKWQKKNPEKVRASSKARYALAIGKIQKLPCRDCGSMKSVMHHEDYSKPCDVIWLCGACHARVHKK